MKRISFLPILLCISLSLPLFAQETTIQFPRIDFHMGMNQELKPSISYNADVDIIAGDKSGLVFSLGIAGEDLNLQSGINDLVQLGTLKLSISPSSRFNFHTFYGRYKYLGEDKVIPRGFQFNYTPGTDYYGYTSISGAGLAVTFPVQEGRYEPEFAIYSDNANGIDYLNFDHITTFRFEKWYMELYLGVAIPTIGSLDPRIKGHGGFSIFTTLDYVNVYFAVFVPPHYGETFEIDDIYMRFSQYLLINGFEQTLSVYTLGAESGDVTDPLVGINGIPDLNIFTSIGGRINNIGFGFDYGFIYGLYKNEMLVNNILSTSHRVGAYVDMMFLGLTYKIGLFYTLPNSAAYIHENVGPGDIGLYVSVYGRS